MTEHVDSIAKLAANLSKLPSVGEKTALRYAYYILKAKSEYVDDLINAIKDVREKVKFCKICGNYCEDEVCEICSTRDHKVICVVTEPKDITAIEKLRNFKGVYHVLNGVLNPMLDIGPNDIRIKELIARLKDVEEVVIATDTDRAGEATASYLSSLIKPYGIKVTRIARGLPEGASVEYADQGTLTRSFANRYEI